MKRHLAFISLPLLTILLLLAACGGGDAQEAPPTATATSAPTRAPTVMPTNTPEPLAETTPAGEQTAASPTAETSVDTTTPADDVRAFVIVPEQTQARFYVDELLLGVPTTVEGVTNLVTGEVTVDVTNPANTTIGPITIDARDLKTDRDLRNRAIRRFILQSSRDEYQYITFTPTSIAGLPDHVAPGDRITFEVTGDLKIREIARPVTFSVELTVASGAQISGQAATTVMRSDFDLSIPNAPGVADVSEEVRLELAFTAMAD